MKTITIDFTAETVVSDYDLGRIGEHNATQLTITPPDALTLEPRTATYRVQFRTGSEVVTSESFTTVPFTIPLWQQLTEHSRLSLQIIAYDADGEYIGKSEKLSGFYFEPSVAGNSEEADKEVKSLVHEVNENTAARHTHDNKAVLDEIPGFDAEDKDKMLIVGEDGLEWKTPSKEVIEIWNYNSNASKYTDLELSALMAMNPAPILTYKGNLIIDGKSSASPRRFYFSYVSVETGGYNVPIKTMKYYKMEVLPNKTVRQLAFRIVPNAVNGQTADDNGDITLSFAVGDIIVPDGYEPTADDDIATKKYVDDTNGIVEKVLEAQCDFDTAAVISGLLTQQPGSGVYQNGESVVLIGDQTGVGGLLHNARVTGIELPIFGNWYNANFATLSQIQPTICSIPFLALDDDSNVYTVVGFTDNIDGGIESAEAIRIHYIEIKRVEVVTND